MTKTVLAGEAVLSSSLPVTGKRPIRPCGRVQAGECRATAARDAALSIRM